MLELRNLGVVLTRTTTYIFRSIGFIFGCLRQHTKFWRHCRGVILVDFCASCEPYFILEIFNQKKKKNSLVFDSYGFSRILTAVELGLDSIVF